MRPARLPLAHLPTPVWRNSKLDELIGTELWVKRDDMTAGAEAGNKIRKLEYLLADAKAKQAEVVITCGAAQSNHARATALLARQLGMDSWLLLRATSEEDKLRIGNLLLDRVAGASIQFVSPDEYTRRDETMRKIAEQHGQLGRVAYVIPEGGSNGLGTFGYVQAMVEVCEQAAAGLLPRRFDTVVVACGSGGTAAGVALGLAETGLAPRVDAFAVCDDAAHFDAVCTELCRAARLLCPELPPPVELIVHDQFKGPRYGVMSAEQAEFLAEVAATTGLILDPVYSGKALFGLASLKEKPRRALFVHTGGLPGLLAHEQVQAANTT